MLKKKECCAEFREELRQALGSREELSHNWERTAEVLRTEERRQGHLVEERRRSGKYSKVEFNEAKMG